MTSNPHDYLPAKFQGRLSLSTRLLVFFAASPDEELSTADVSVKFDYTFEKVHEAMRGLVNAGLVRKVKVGKNGTYSVYGAGPRLLQEIGRVSDAYPGAGQG